MFFPVQEDPLEFLFQFADQKRTRIRSDVRVESTVPSRWPTPFTKNLKIRNTDARKSIVIDVKRIWQEPHVKDDVYAVNGRFQGTD